ncbi:unnamed protein product, partial [Medioppia subpectinata]
KITENQLLQDAPPEGVSDSQQPSNDLELERGCDKAGAEPMSVTELCALPPHKGTGNDDIFRYYYNPVVQMCLPFSYSGKGGNSNRFVSVKNCYEICHPADPSVKKPRVVSAIRAYLVPNQKSDCPKPTPITAREYVVRHLPHPLNPAYTLSIVQSVQHVDRPKDMHFDHVERRLRAAVRHHGRDLRERQCCHGNSTQEGDRVTGLDDACDDTTTTLPLVVSRNGMQMEINCRTDLTFVWIEESKS